MTALRSRDHPRLRGEKCKFAPNTLTTQGSPPLTRGKVHLPFRPDVPRRITPAYAGKSHSTDSDESSTRDHPRLRGEKFASKDFFKPKPGSPPLTRGKASQAIIHMLDPGITPAYAGKSCRILPAVSCNEDHPRLRGEKRGTSTIAETKMGSPPLTRGKEITFAEARNLVRITPAYAGKSN